MKTDTIEELVAVLKQFNPKAKVNVIVHNKAEDFSIAWTEGDTAEDKPLSNSKEVSFYVDRLNGNDQ